MHKTNRSERLTAVHANALREFDEIQAAVKDERLQCLQDRRFYSIAGAQWEGNLGEQFENKPRFEVNKIHLSVVRIFNEYRTNRISVVFNSKAGDEADAFADTCSSLYRADEQNSCAEEAYDNAFEEAVGGGFGAWRLRTEYEDEGDDDNDYQSVKIEPIFDADSCVFFDLDARRQDKADAKSCYVLTGMTRNAFIEKYDEDPRSWNKEVCQSQFDWTSPDIVYVAELYKVEEAKETIYTFEGMLGEEKKVNGKDLDSDPDLAKTLQATGFKEIKKKKVVKKQVHKYILSGGGVLEDCGIIAGKNIPIVPVFGKRWFVDNVERAMGHVRLAKDAQRLKNMQLSKLGEISALSSVEKPIFTPEQVSSHAVMWAEDNVKNYPYLLINPLTDNMGNTSVVGPVAYTKAPNIPPAMAALLQITEQDMQNILGNQQQGEALPAAVSGRAIELVQNKVDMQTYIYISNMSKAIRRSGEIWLSIAKDIFTDRSRKLKAVSKTGENSTVELIKPMYSEESSSVVYENDFSNAKFDVSVDVGPSSSSKRESTVRSLTGMMQMTTDPETLQVLSSMAMMNIEGEGMSDIRDFFRKKLVKLGAVKPSKEEAAELQAEYEAMPPDANTEFLKASAAQASAEAVKAQSSAMLNLAKAEETKAKTAETLGNVTKQQRDHMKELANSMGKAINLQNSYENMPLPIDNIE